MMGVKPVSDGGTFRSDAPVSKMVAAVKNGKGKMKPVAGLTDAQIKDVVLIYAP
jgi:hypothetical protein